MHIHMYIHTFMHETLVTLDDRTGERIAQDQPRGPMRARPKRAWLMRAQGGPISARPNRASDLGQGPWPKPLTKNGPRASLFLGHEA